MERKHYKINSTDIFVIIAAFAFLIGIWVIAPYLPDQYPRIIKGELKKQGYDVEGIEFVRDKQYEEMVYQSSVSIFYEGNDVVLWLLKRNYLPSILSRYYKFFVEPYTPPDE